MKTYINMRENSKVETIDEFDNRREARAMLPEYRMCMNWPVIELYLSQRCTNDWKAEA